MSRCLVVIVGATASGKSAVAEAVARRVDSELVSADAFQVYRGFDIGTAKPDAAARARYRYHCLDFLAPDRRCTAGDYARVARDAIDAILRRGRLPVLVGGTGFYIETVVRGLADLPPSDHRWRTALTTVQQRRGHPWAHAALRRLDAARAGEIDVADVQRTLRALEVVLRSGRPLSWHRSHGNGPRQLESPVLWFGVRRPREQLGRRIAHRIRTMLAEGWQQEVEALLRGGVSPQAHAMQAIGYRELAQVCSGELALVRAEERIERATRRYAKRQRTWFAREPEVEWLDMNDDSDTSTGAAAAWIVARIQALERATVSRHGAVPSTLREQNS